MTGDEETDYPSVLRVHGDQNEPLRAALSRGKQVGILLFAPMSRSLRLALQTYDEWDVRRRSFADSHERILERRRHFALEKISASDRRM
jgi:hypothetical protein